jgi:predicted alpha/beta-hydrolase family hydrolase
MSASQESIDVDGQHRVAALALIPPSARACFVLAHGAGAGMAHPFMQAVALGLSDRNVATLRFQFPYMERGSRRPDAPALCHATIRAAVTHAADLCPRLPLIAGGRSFGGRMSSQAQALYALPGVRGLAFLGFPLHPAGKPSDQRAAHLFQTEVPLLFLQGDRDALASLTLLQPIVHRLGARATLALIGNADHSFKVPARSGRTAAQIMTQLLTTLHDWIEAIIADA